MYIYIYVFVSSAVGKSVQNKRSAANCTVCKAPTPHLFEQEARAAEFTQRQAHALLFEDSWCRFAKGIGS